MKKTFLTLILFTTFELFAQDYELRISPTVNCEIIYKDGTIEKGMLWLANSAFNPRLKSKNKGKDKKIDYKNIDKIISNPETENKRVFQYLNSNYNKFKIFVELIYTDEICIYIGSKENGTDLFYSGFDRETIREKFLKMKYESSTFNQLKDFDTLQLPNGKKMAVPLRYSYYNDLQFASANGNSPAYQYYLLKKSNPILLKVEGNKRFLKKSKEFFSDCPSLIKKLETKELTLEDLTIFIEYYKEKCGIKNI